MDGFIFGFLLVRTVEWCITMDIKIARFIISIIRSAVDNTKNQREAER